MFGRAVAEFDARVRQIGDHQWQAATPDEDWTVRDLVNHLVGEDLWAPPLLAGSTIAEVGDRFEGDVLGAEPKAAWAAASAAAVRAAGEDGAPRPQESSSASSLVKPGRSRRAPRLRPDGVPCGMCADTQVRSTCPAELAPAPLRSGSSPPTTEARR